MKVLVVCRYKEGYEGDVAPFVKEQVDAIRSYGVECEYFLVKGKGITGYFSHLKALKNKIKEYCPDLLHAHYGLCGLLANMQRKVPVVTTYHGSDINDGKVLPLSKVAMSLSAWNILVSRRALEKSGLKKKYTLLPCGIDLSDLQLIDKAEARRRLDLNVEKRIVVFPGAFDNKVKNVSLAKETMALLGDSQVELHEMKGYSREKAMLLLCAADVMLLTSLSEGSPQVVKEAMACGCPIVSVDVGDVRERLEGVDGCYVTLTREPNELAELLRKALAFDGKTPGRNRLVTDGLDNRQVSAQLVDLYEKVCVR